MKRVVADQKIELPFYAKASLIIIGLFILISMLSVAQGIIVPIVFALIIAIVLHPVVAFFVKLRFNRIVAIALTIFLTFVVVVSLGAFIFIQARKFGESWPILVDKFTLILNQSISTLSAYIKIDPMVVDQWIVKTKTELLSSSNTLIAEVLISIGGGLMTLLLVPVYVFIILYYHRLLIEFIHRVFGKSDQKQVNEIVSQTKTVIQRYLVGLIIEALIIAVLDSAALLSLGIQYAILLGILGALLNMIPYIGGLVAVAMPMMVALATKDSGWYAIYVLVLYYIIQLIDNNYVVPIIVSSKVKINALFAIVVVIAGNQLWGISGMFLSIPLLAIIKLIFDHIEPLKPWGFLLGDTMPALSNVKTNFRNINKTKK